MSVFLGIDIGGTKIAGGLVTDTGDVLKTVRRPTPLTGGADILNTALSVARELIAQADQSIAAIGVGTGGQVDCDRGVILAASEILPGWKGTPVKAAFEEALGLPTFVDNDVNALAVGESHFGAGRGLKTVLYVALGTGVGGAIVLNGQVHHGTHGSGGEIGSLILTVDAQARVAQSGEPGTLEAYASGPGLVQTWRELTGSTDESVTGQTVAEEAQRNPGGAAAQAITRTGEYLGYGLVSLANVLDPNLIVISGGLASLGDALLNPARRILQERALPGPAQCQIVPASLGPEASVIGAACLGMAPLPQFWGAGSPNPGPFTFVPGLSLAQLHPTPSEGRMASLRAGIGSSPAPQNWGGGASLTLALVPLDERPVNTHYPQMLGAIGGANVLLPPEEIRGFLRQPADVIAAGDWLRQAAQTADAAIVSCEFLGYGNLIASRISHDSAAAVLTRLNLLAAINSICPVHAFSLITRVPNADDCVEEPEYWAQWGTKFHRYAQLTHQAERGELANPDELAQMELALPQDGKADWLTRRLRNHTVTLGLLDMAARGQITALRLTSDDTSPWGFPSRERDWLGGWPRLIGPVLSQRVMMHPGADEVGSALLAKLLMDGSGRSPRVWPLYSMAGDEAMVAPYEDRPVRETVEGQLAACGGVLAESPEEADIILGVATPSPRLADYRPEFLEGDRRDRTAGYREFLAALGAWQTQGVPIALADVAYPNGSDPLLLGLLLSKDAPLRPGKLCAYGAWNTAGNTLGVAIAQAACALLINSDARRAQAQRIFLAHRFLEDWGYQSVVRREARGEAERLWGRREPAAGDENEQATLCAFIEGRLKALLGELQARGIGEGLSVTPGSVRLPWQRTFEVDFTLT